MGKKKKDKNGKDRRYADSPKIPLLHPETTRSIVAIVLFVAAAVMLLAVAGQGGKGGAFASSIAHNVLGKGFILVPLSLILASLSIFTSLHERIYAPTLIGSGLFLVSFEGLLHLIFTDVRGGGYVGYAVAEPLLQLFNIWPTLVILVGLIIISLVIAFNIPLRIILFAKKHKEEKAYIEKREKPEVSAQTAKEDEPEKPEKPIEAAKDKKELAVSKDDEAPVFEVKGLGAEDEKIKKPYREKRPRVGGSYVFPPLDLLEEETGEPSSGDIKTTASVIKRALSTFGIEVEMGEVNIGPTVTQYTLRPASGIKLSRITALASDLALALAAHPIRIEAPIPGRSLVGIEIPNTAIMVVRLRNLLNESILKKQSVGGLSLALGRDVAGAPTFSDLERMPHLLVAGATGSGKSICIHSILTALLYQNSPDTLRFILIDPKRVELSHYNDIPHLLTPVITQPLKMVHALRWAVREMESRYERLSKVGSRDLLSFNKKVEPDERLPFIVIVIDELADIMAAFGKDVEGMIVRLAQMARAIGIHLIVSTQRPSVEVITGLIKANITTRIAFQVASGIDSRTILDSTGAEKLLGRGDMLFLAADAQKPRRIQSPFVSEKEVERVTNFIKEHVQGEVTFEEDITSPNAGAVGEGGEESGDSEDDLYSEAKKLVQETGKASATFLQRRFKIGYARAARLLDILENHGVVGPGEGAKPREVYGTNDDFTASEGKKSSYNPPDSADEDFGDEVGAEEVIDEEEGEGIPVV